MPTGYTADVEDGKVTEFVDFALACARNFGALITMRDEPKGTPIPEAFTVSQWTRDSVVNAEHRLAELENMGREEIDAAVNTSYVSRLKSYQQSVADYKVKNDRYQKMLDKVNAWTPPTPDHQGMKDFMIQQLESSMYDDKWLSVPQKTSVSEWYREELDRANRAVESARKRLDEEIQRVAERNLWVQALRESLKNYDG
jgi:hypothetical protein